LKEPKGNNVTPSVSETGWQLSTLPDKTEQALPAFAFTQ
jgi:hypothetical protein